MKRKMLYIVLLVVITAVCIRIHLDFHSLRRFVSYSPVDSHVVDCVPDGLADICYHFRAHDLRASPFRPIIIADLYWEHRYFSGSLYWSRDGSVAAASIISYADGSEALACAYDFREHRAIRSGSVGSPSMLPVTGKSVACSRLVAATPSTLYRSPKSYDRND
jgi:hypothetical protein